MGRNTTPDEGKTESSEKPTLHVEYDVTDDGREVLRMADEDDNCLVVEYDLNVDMLVTERDEAFVTEKAYDNKFCVTSDDGQGLNIIKPPQGRLSVTGDYDIDYSDVSGDAA